MIMSIEKIRERIRLLLNVAKNDASTEGEINNALKAAGCLMKKHHLSEEDIKADDPEDFVDFKAKIDGATRDRVFVSVGGRIFQWESSLGAFVREFVGGLVVYRDETKVPARDHRGLAMRDPIWGEYYNGKRLCFVGIAEDAMLAAEMFHELRLTIASMGRLKFGSCYTKEGGVYCQGFVAGLFSKIEVQNKLEYQEATGTGLILIEKREQLIGYKADKAKEWLEQTFKAKLSSGWNAEGATGSREAYEEGYADGQSSEVSKKRNPKIEA